MTDIGPPALTTNASVSQPNGSASSPGELKTLDEGGEMAPKPSYDDLFIEPAGDYDVVYGDYNATMDGGTGRRPYLRLTSALPNVTRHSGGEVRLKCEAAGDPLPIQFAWLKNLAPVEKNRRTRIRNKEFSSKLVIIDLDVLDSGYYQCTASNVAGSVNTTSVLRVNPSATSNSASSLRANTKGTSVIGGGGGKLLSKHQNPDAESYDESYDDYEVNSTPPSRNTKHSSVDAQVELQNINMRSGDADDSTLFNVPDSAGGPGYVPLSHQRPMGGAGSDRWLDGVQLRKGDCVLYRGESCANYLTGKYIKITSDSRESVYEDDRHIKASMIFIQSMPNVSDQCKRYSHMVACYHRFKVCDKSFYFPSQQPQGHSSSPSGSRDHIVSICRDDCDALTTRVCPQEMAMATADELVGDGPKTLMPRCESLSANAPQCFRVLKEGDDQLHVPQLVTPRPPPPKWCYLDSGRVYEGEIATTRSNRPCLPWSQSASVEFNTAQYPELARAGNHCRNPGGKRSEPWCYTLPTTYPSSSSSANYHPVEESCAVPKCPPNMYPNSGPAGRGDGQPGFMDSVNDAWQSLSAQWQLAVMSSVGALAILLLLALVCCACCRRNSRRRRKTPSSTFNQQPLEPPGSAPSSMFQGGMNEVGSIVSSGNMKKGANLGMASCNGGCSSTITGSDMNSAVMRKYREEAARNQGGGEVLNPLLGLNQPGVPMGLNQQQLFELKRQQQQMPNYWQVAGEAQQPQPTYAQPPSAQFHGYAHPMHAFHQQHHTAPHSEYSPHTSTEPPAEPYQIPTIQEQQLKFDKVIGEDSSTIVYLGEWLGGMISGAALQVAIKTLKPGATHAAIENFREEIKEVGPFEHLNVIRMHGVAYLSQQNISAVFDYMVHGDLHEFLKVREPRSIENDERERSRNNEDLLRISIQIAAGMEYLAANGYVHRDLAARNCLVGDQQVIKIADFGRMKQMYEHHYHRLNASTRVPLRWLSKEALNEGKYSHASDVYAFGITLWEIYTYGALPYSAFTDKQVIQLVNEEAPLDIPAHCPSILYGIMIECFHPNPKRRPTFPELHGRLQKWCSSGQAAALMSHQHRASSIHSGGGGGGSSSGSAAMGVGRHGAGKVPSSNQVGLRGGSTGGLLDQFGGSCSVPSPAPNSTSAGGSGGQMAKLTMLSDGVGVAHSTPIGRGVPKGPNSPQRQRINGGRRACPYTDDDEDEDDYSTDEST